MNDAARGGEALGHGDLLAASGFLALTFGGEALKGARALRGLAARGRNARIWGSV
jgi:hypothetical protein